MRSGVTEIFLLCTMWYSKTQEYTANAFIFAHEVCCFAQITLQQTCIYSIVVMFDTLPAAPEYLQYIATSQDHIQGTPGALTGNSAHPNVCFSRHSAVCHKQLR